MAKPRSVLRQRSPSCAGGGPPSMMCVTAFSGRAAWPFSMRLAMSAAAADAAEPSRPAATTRPIKRRTAATSCLLRLRDQLFFARLHLFAQRLQVEILGLFRLGEHLAFLFLHMVHDVLAEYGEGGV